MYCRTKNGWVVELMSLIKMKELFHKLLSIFMIILVIQIVHVFLGWPPFDFVYLLILTGVLALGDYWEKSRFICFLIILFLIDISPGFVILPLLYSFLVAKNYFLQKK